MNILFYFGHPSQYLFLNYAMQSLRKKGINCDIIIKSKDVLEELIKNNKEDYLNILPEGRKSGGLGFLIGLLKRDWRLYKFVKNKPYDMFIGTDPSLAHIGLLRKIPVITILEDDIHIIQNLARLTFPFTSLILTPAECKTGKFENITIHYQGYMKLAYLHPKWYRKSDSILNRPYFLIRRSKLEAYHDNNISGLTDKLLFVVINILEKYGNVYISSEGKLSNSFEKYKLDINPSEMQKVLANAKLFVSDSQSMSMEASMLGVPSIRYSDFAGRISVLEELEHKYRLTFGIPTKNPEKLIAKIYELLSYDNLEEEFSNRRERMLSDKIDVTAFMVWFFENYPSSVRIMRDNPDYQYNFK